MSGAETNMASIVLRVSYGAQSFILSGDSPQAIERYLVSIDGAGLKSTVLKAGHHGSNTSSDVSFVAAVDPEYVVYSRGCDNTYGHPHQETIDTFNAFGVTAYDTCTDGTIVFKSDGTTLHVNTKF
jgi:beta-lactamase superfamily II metal-dependent hydrolase